MPSEANASNEAEANIPSGKEVKESMLKGAESTNTELITVKREQLIEALKA